MNKIIRGLFKAIMLIIKVIFSIAWAFIYLIFAIVITFTGGSANLGGLGRHSRSDDDDSELTIDDMMIIDEIWDE